MRIRSFLLMLIFCLSLLTPAQDARAVGDEEGWEVIEPGIDYREYTLEGPKRVFVARMDRSVPPQVILDTSIAQGRLAYGLEKVSDMAKRYDDAINFVEYPSETPYEYGFRNKVVVAINGSFLEDETTIPYSGMIQSGWYTKRYDDYTGAAFGWKYDLDVIKRQAFIADCVYHKANKQYIWNIESEETVFINGINVPRPSNSMVLYTSQYDTTTRTESNGVEVLVEMKRAVLILSQNWGAKGTVVAIRENAGSTPIPFDHIVLSAHGTAAARLLEVIGVGDEIEVDQEVTSLDSDCKYEVPIPNWVKTFAGITGDWTYLKASVFNPHPTKNLVLDPRTAIAFNDQYIYFIVVDGRQPGLSIGMTYGELASFSVSELQATWGLAMDSGGSSTMVINGLVMNIPSDPCTRRIFLPVIGADNPVDPDPDDSDLSLAPADETGFLPTLLCERRVGNGVMMIALQDRLSSDLFEPGNRVWNKIGAEVRLGPGTNYALLATMTESIEGTIIHQINDLDGIYAKGAFWWKVDFGTVVGWVNQDSLSLLQPTNYSPR
jgi:hypothetical protein